MKEKKGKLQTILLLVVLLFFCVGTICWGVSPIILLKDAEHYNRVYQNPLVATATVTDHRSYDDEGDTDYKSYISYVIDGKEFSDVKYEDKDVREKLTPIGEIVKVKVSPENPGKLISNLKQSVRMLVFVLVFFALFLAVVWNSILTRKCSKTTYEMPDTETIQRDVKLTICGRMTHFTCFILWAGLLFLRYRYSTVFGDVVLFAAIILGVLWLWFVCMAVRDNNYMRNNEYELRYDVLVKKEHSSDSDGDTYTLYYQSGDKTWEKSTNRVHFNKVTEGTTVVAVYLPGRKKPIFHYDR